MEVVPTKFRKLWKEWDLRIFVLLSLTLQIILVILGSRRKYIPRPWIRIVVWSAYLVADSIAIFGIGTLSNDLAVMVDDKGSLNANVELTAFWAPFLLLHLGGPDTITAYSLEDNNLWLRHFLGLALQTGGTVYIFLMAWTGSHLSILTILMILAGFIKYGERVWVLRQASYEQRRESPPDPGPNYSKLMEEYHLKMAEGYHVMPDEVIEVKGAVDLSLFGNDFITDAEILLKAHGLLQRFKGLFVDLLLTDVDRDTSRFIFTDMSFEDAFKFVEIELGFMYDLLYTKAAIVCNPWGCACRIISLSLTFSALVVFSLAENYTHLEVDSVITFILLSVAVLLEFYAILLQLSSDRFIVWLCTSNIRNNRFFFNILRAIIPLKRFKRTRWSDSISQFSLLSFSVNRNPKSWSRILNHVDQRLEKQLFVTCDGISPALKKSIFEHLKEKLYEGDADLKFLCTYRGGNVLEKFNCLESLGWSTKLEFDRSILIWHIATELYYYKGISKQDEATAENEVEAKSTREISKHISQYMLYLLVMYPFMLPTGIGQIRFRDTSSEIMNFFAKQKPISGTLTHSEACNKLLGEKSQLPAFIAKGDRSKSVLFDACKLFSQLQNISDTMPTKEIWKMVREVWLEMLTYGASQCGGNNHAQQLRRGGELLTHVWLLMAHLGISDQFQMSEGHVIAKLIVR